eukprot:PhM_4_TR18660/c0_g1_i1/m.19857
MWHLALKRLSRLTKLEQQHHHHHHHHPLANNSLTRQRLLFVDDALNALFKTNRWELAFQLAVNENNNNSNNNVDWIGRACVAAKRVILTQGNNNNNNNNLNNIIDTHLPQTNDYKTHQAQIMLLLLLPLQQNSDKQNKLDILFTIFDLLLSSQQQPQQHLCQKTKNKKPRSYFWLETVVEALHQLYILNPRKQNKRIGEIIDAIVRALEDHHHRQEKLLSELLQCSGIVGVLPFRAVFRTTTTTATATTTTPFCRLSIKDRRVTIGQRMCDALVSYFVDELLINDNNKEGEEEQPCEQSLLRVVRDWSAWGGDSIFHVTSWEFLLQIMYSHNHMIFTKRPKFVRAHAHFISDTLSIGPVKERIYFVNSLIDFLHHGDDGDDNVVCVVSHRMTSAIIKRLFLSRSLRHRAVMELAGIMKFLPDHLDESRYDDDDHHLMLKIRVRTDFPSGVYEMLRFVFVTFLGAREDLPEASISRLVDEGYVSVDGEALWPSTPIFACQIIEIDITSFLTSLRNNSSLFQPSYNHQSVVSELVGMWTSVLDFMTTTDAADPICSATDTMFLISESMEAIGVDFVSDGHFVLLQSPSVAHSSSHSHSSISNNTFHFSVAAAARGYFSMPFVGVFLGLPVKTKEQSVKMVMTMKRNSSTFDIVYAPSRRMDVRHPISGERAVVESVVEVPRHIVERVQRVVNLPIVANNNNNKTKQS